MNLRKILKDKLLILTYFDNKPQFSKRVCIWFVKNASVSERLGPRPSTGASPLYPHWKLLPKPANVGPVAERSALHILPLQR